VIHVASTPPRTDEVPHTSILDSLRTLLRVLLPLTARGVIVRRPAVVRLAERLDLDRRAVQQMQRLRERYGDGPLLLRLPFRRLALVLDPDHVHRILQGSPEPFASANLEKEHALAHFQPRGVLISHGRARERRREVNEGALDTHAPVHHLAEDLIAKTNDEVDRIRDHVGLTGELDWDAFIDGWARMVRRVALGESAADDEELAEMLTELREHANWSFARPKDDELRERFLERLRVYVERREPGSLVAMFDRVPTDAEVVPHEQVPQWLFAFEPAGMATFRTLALLATHPEHRDHVRAEVAGLDLSRPHELPFTQACVLESLRLWPTTPGILRDTTTDTTWEHGRLPEGSGVLIFAPFFHRDETRLVEAHRFAPELWADPRSVEDWPLVPFSAGPVVCPGQPLVLLLASTVVARLVSEHELRLRDPGRLERAGRLPSVLDNFSLRFDLRRRAGN
jgi:cytochrome P450